MTNRRYRKTPGGFQHVKEADVLKHTKDYLSWEKITFVRNQAGVCRFGGQPIKLPDKAKEVIMTLPALEGKKWDGRIRINEQWAELSPAGTPDLTLRIPKHRLVMNPWTREYEKFPVARTAYIDTKKPGAKLTAEQLEFAKVAEADGALFWKIDSPEKLREMIPSLYELRFSGPPISSDDRELPETVR